MTNYMNERRSNKLVYIALIATLIVSLTGVVTALYFIIHRADTEERTRMPSYVLEESAASLKGVASSMRLCNSEEAAAPLAREALVYAVRAETALECEDGDCMACRSKEAFLNDVCALLMGKGPMAAVEKADELYRLSCAFCGSLKGGEFEYDGSLADAKEEDKASPAMSVEEAGERVKKATGATSVTHIGGYGDRIEFAIERDNCSGYAVVKGEGVYEFSLCGKGAPTNKETAERVALAAAEACGHSGLSVYGTEVRDGYATVELCHVFGGAMACEECARVRVSGDAATAFYAGKCDNTCHKLPTVKRTEREARGAAAGAKEKGRLVTTFDGERDRVCYEYRVELDDGVHSVYVCAETGEQHRVK